MLQRTLSSSIWQEGAAAGAVERAQARAGGRTRRGRRSAAASTQHPRTSQRSAPEVPREARHGRGRSSAAAPKEPFIGRFLAKKKKSRARKNLPLFVPHFFVYGRGAAVGRGGLKIRLFPDTFTAATAHAAHPAPRVARLASRTQLHTHKNTPNSLYIRVYTGIACFFSLLKQKKWGEQE